MTCYHKKIVNTSII